MASDATGFKPSADMLLVVSAAKRQIATDPNALQALHPMKWCVAAGLPASQWDTWLAEYGNGFERWFAQQLGMAPLERAALDRLFIVALGRVLASENPTAAHLKLWADMNGHTNFQPEPPGVPVLSATEALDYLVGMGPAVLAQALQTAQEREARRLGAPTEDTHAGNEGSEPEAP